MTGCRYVTVLDPKLRTEPKCLESMNDLSEFLPMLITPEESDEFSTEMRRFSICDDTVLPTADMRIDSWWAAAAAEFPLLSRVALAYLTIFSGKL